MHNHCINKLLNLEDVIVKKISHADHSVKIYLETKPSEQVCPSCGKKTTRIHDYRYQNIKDLALQEKATYLVLRKRRYACSCGKRFYEHYSFLPKYHQRTLRLSYKVLDKFRKVNSITSVAEDTNLSTSTVSRILDSLNYIKPTLPSCLCIDEFKGNTEAGKYQCILVDGKKRSILDILPDRNQSHLCDYFRSYSSHERYQVRFFVCDMWRPYVDLAEIFFPHAKVIIDKYHFIRQITWAIENVRKRIQKTMVASLRKYYKRSHKLILTRYYKLSKESKKACDLMLLYNDDLRVAHRLKEWFYEICQNDKYSCQRVDLWEWIKTAECCGVKEFEKCATTIRTWAKYILNAFKYGHTNGPTEGYNNKIKVLKRVSFGVRNFKRFRLRILHSSN